MGITKPPSPIMDGMTGGRQSRESQEEASQEEEFTESTKLLKETVL
ncbi:hypothetical protein NHH03_13070 [Stieleria sp. TO1_6]|nr:hypothetical protein [Stieleria tagensis]MCO8122672.1 hypothetical protein [Stieleria tagensis]